MKNLYTFLVLLGGILTQAQTYCSFTTSPVEPITSVNIRNSSQSVTLLNNQTPPTSTQAHELFLDQVVHVYSGERYWVRLRAREMTIYYTIFADWNQNGTLDDEGEVYQIGITAGSNQEALGALDVPAGLPPGEIRMRIIGKTGGYANNPCAATQAGQAEDYTISIDSVGGNDDYCTYTSDNILPITSVNFAGINNQTANTSIYEQEYFLNRQARLVRGQNQNITLKGNTGGNNTDYYTLFVDWNKNDVLDNEGEVYQLGTITNSTGTDAAQLVTAFDVPEDLPFGPTRIRFIKNRGSYATDPCGDYEFGQAEDYTLTVRNPTPQDDGYCGPLVYSYGTEPITYVNFAGIDNRSTNSTTAPDHEYFLDLEGNVEKGQAYEIKLEGNTNGNWTSAFSVFIDWNQNNSFDDFGERYEIGKITFSDGEDGDQISAMINVPYAALSGVTRMRVMKMYGSNAYPEESCATDNLGGDDASGQAEDYTIIVNAICEEPSLTVDVNSLEACEGTTATLEALTDGGQVFWFTSEDATTPIGSGLNFETPELTETTTFWAEASSGEFYEGGRTAPENFNSAEVNTVSSPWGLAFNLNQEATINSVDVYVAGEAGNMIVKLIDENFAELYNKTIALPAGNVENPVRFEAPLGFALPAGNFRLVVESTPALVRETAQQHQGFPYELGELGEITSGVIGNGSTNNNYYFLYNWKLNSGDSECKSERVAVEVNVNPAPDAPVGDETQIFVLGETLDDLEVTGENLTWYADANGETELTADTELVDGTTYYVSQNNGTCESEFLAITVYLELGVADMNKAEFAYYPNPVKDILTISGKSNIFKIEVFELSGKLILSQNSNSKSIALNLTSIHSGVYVVKATSENKTETFKIIKK